jgi:hypothetical protein
VSAVAYELDGQLQAGAGLAFDEHLRFGAWRGAGPAGAWLETRLAACGTTSEVHFIGCGTMQSRVRAVGIVPGDEEIDFAMHGAAQEWQDGQSAHAFLERPDEALDHSDAAWPADGAKALANGVTAAPVLETFA